ncbi:hypothetical protein MSAN_01494300 [Mycena sanguinolenta]|uniref:Uncharacterized protein n=1 Tax=Mycena sanguinolenta TaxID=230812 RepID=A0A8H7CYY9_9AGAR|nr:hypothetical protein MSAN_01494300 [Mycena sanguinolenta]
MDAVCVEQVNLDSPWIAYFAEASQSGGVSSVLDHDVNVGYKDKIPSTANLEKLADMMHLLKKPEWIPWRRWTSEDAEEFHRLLSKYVPKIDFTVESDPLIPNTRDNMG